MSRSPAHVLAARVCALGALLAVAACAGAVPRADGTGPSRSSRPAGSRTSAPAPTEAQVRAALLTEADLGPPWRPTEGAATWRDGMLKATADQPDCARLLDALYADELLGGPAGIEAATGFDDADDTAQLRQRVLVRGAGEVDRTLAWLRTLPRTCGRFAATGPQGRPQDVRVAGADLPGTLGDARQGLHVVITTVTSDGTPVTLTLDTAAVRVGDTAVTVTTGGLGAVPPDITRRAAERAVQRLAEPYEAPRTGI
ncbi:hypothetical protein ACFOOM_22505 [Streptomyces echinoruber]|nr:hypothetical protein [Streptomyces echinoruber]